MHAPIRSLTAVVHCRLANPKFQLGYHEMAHPTRKEYCKNTARLSEWDSLRCWWALFVFAGIRFHVLTSFLHGDGITAYRFPSVIERIL